MSERVGQVFGNYQLLRFLGQGAFAEVYLGEHRYIEMAAAIKVLTHMEPETHEAFRNEARAIARLEHPHIIRLRDFGIQDGTPYLIMDYMPNGTLRALHPRGTRLPFEQIVSYVQQIASALDYAHQQRLIHRDIKPENILLNARREVLLSDFGLAVVLSTVDSLSTQNEGGTPLYMAPEQINNHPGPASDQYALAVMVYEWLCGKPPFQGPLYELFSQHLYQTPPSLCDRAPEISPEIEDVVFGALAKDPQERFSSIQDFAIALEEACFATQTMPAIQSVAPRLSVPVPRPVQPESPEPIVAVKVESTPDPPLPTSTHMNLLPATQKLRGPAPETISGAQTNRQRLIRRVRAFWIEGVLEHSLQGAALLNLGLQEQPNAVANPWQSVLQRPSTMLRPLPPGTLITQVYDSANEALLILGAPGGGKTTLLLTLACDLLHRAERDTSLPVPVIFNLSSWTLKRQGLHEWLAEEMSSKYQVPRKLAHALIEHEQILPLLDGLDEVDAGARAACISAINGYRQEHGMQPMVVCSRVTDYMVQTERINLTSAVTIQPLTPAQIQIYVASGGEALRALQIALQQDTELRELAETPLMLNVLMQAYQGMSVQTLSRDGIAPTRRQVFDRYIARMLATRGAKEFYAPEQTRTWLSWLAQQLKRHGQTVFYIERIQPSWLPDKRSLRLYNLFAVRLPAVLMGMLVGIILCTIPSFNSIIYDLLEMILLGGLLGWLLSEKSEVQFSFDEDGGRARSSVRLLQRTGLAAILGLIVGVSSWLATSNPFGALLFGLKFGCCCFLFMLLLRKDREVKNSSQTTEGPKRLRSLRSVVLYNGLLVGSLIGLSYALNTNTQAGLLTKLLAGLVFMLLAGLISGLISAMLIGKSAEIQLADRLTWRSFGRSLLSQQHWRSVWQIALLAGLPIGLIAGLLKDIKFGLLFGLISGLLFGLSYWLLHGLFRGVESKTIEDQQRAIPNQGIRHSALNGLIYGLILTVFVGLSAGLLFRSGKEVLQMILAGLIIGVSVGLIAWLLKGGLAFLRHYTLRLLLQRHGTIPRHYRRFLDETVERILLRRVGGGYIFLHRLLLDHFITVL
jgi:serine/threonine protein kinase